MTFGFLRRWRSRSANIFFWRNFAAPRTATKAMIGSNSNDSATNSSISARWPAALNSHAATLPPPRRSSSHSRSTTTPFRSTASTGTVCGTQRNGALYCRTVGPVSVAYERRRCSSKQAHMKNFRRRYRKPTTRRAIGRWGVKEPYHPGHRAAEHLPLPARERKARVAKVRLADVRVHSRG